MRLIDFESVIPSSHNQNQIQASVLDQPASNLNSASTNQAMVLHQPGATSKNASNTLDPILNQPAPIIPVPNTPNLRPRDVKYNQIAYLLTCFYIHIYIYFVLFFCCSQIIVFFSFFHIFFPVFVRLNYFSFNFDKLTLRH